MTPPSSSYPFPTSPTTGIAPLYCSSTRQARYSQQPPNRYPTVTPPSSYPFPTSPITGIASLYCSSTRQACYSQQPSNGYPTMTPPSSSYPFPTSPMPDMATPHFSPTGQARQIIPTQQYNSMMSPPSYPYMTPIMPGQLRQTIQQPDNQYNNTASIPPLSAVNMVPQSTSQSSMIPPDVQLADNQYLLDIMSSFESRCPGQTDLPGLSILANHRELAPPGGTHFANSSSVNTATRSFGFAADPQSHVVDMSIDATINSSGASNGPQSFHSTQYHNNAAGDDLPPSSLLPIYDHHHHHHHHHHLQSAGPPFQTPPFMAPSPTHPRQNRPHRNSLSRPSAKRRRKVHTQETYPSPSTEFSCAWLDEDNALCGVKGSLNYFKDHFMSSHLSGAQSALGRCHWQGCQYQNRTDSTLRKMRRDSMWRHVRERHLKIKRRI